MKKREELKIMKLWDSEIGGMDKKMPVPLDTDKSKYLNLWISQRMRNDKTGAMVTSIKFGKTNEIARFYGGTQRVGRVYATIPTTWEKIKNRESELMPLTDMVEQVDQPYLYTAKTDDGEITFKFQCIYDFENDDKSIEIVLGKTGKALRVYGKLNALMQSEISMPYDYVPSPEIETITL